MTNVRYRAAVRGAKTLSYYYIYNIRPPSHVEDSCRIRVYVYMKGATFYDGYVSLNIYSYGDKHAK